MSLKQIQSPIAADMQVVNTVIRNSLHSEVSLINTIGEHIIGNAGKRLRPALVLLSSGLLGSVSSQQHQIAAIIEFIHTATLLHDDVVDESELRRGKSTANHIFGNAASVLVGDFLYSRAFQMMVAIKNMRVMDILSEATNIIAEGEVLQLLNLHNADVSEAAYLKVIHYKTAKLFEAAARLGAVISEDNNSSDEENLALYGMHLGTAFQLVDDVLDINGDAEKTGKNLGDDLTEGKPTLPILYAMHQSDAKQAAVIRQAIEQGGDNDIPAVLAAVAATNACEYVLSIAKKEADAACAAIEGFADSEYKTAMIQLTEFSVSRQF
ncbi:MAG: polyprenyl synthetase family protein [Methylophilaceae bacterium]|nr:polyprenyl synthetase family protein [Methylophilaceae bacterium]